MKKRLFVSYLCLLLVGSTCFEPKATFGKTPLVEKMTAVWCDTKQICWEKAKNNPLTTLLTCYSLIASLTTLWNWHYKKVYKEQNRKGQEEVKKLKKNQSDSLIFDLRSQALIKQKEDTAKNLKEVPELLKKFTDKVTDLFKASQESDESLIQDIKQKEKIQKIINEQNEKHETEKEKLKKAHETEKKELENKYKEIVQKLNKEKEKLEKAHETEKEKLKNKHKEIVQKLNKEKEKLEKDLEAAKTLKDNTEKSFLEAKKESEKHLDQLNKAQKELNNTKEQLNQKTEESKGLIESYRCLVHLSALSQVLPSDQNENNENENNKTKSIFYKDQEKGLEEFNKNNNNNNLQKQLSNFIQKTGLKKLNFQTGIEQLKNIPKEVVPIQGEN